MSFSSEAKEELSKINNLANKEEVQAELSGYLISNNTSIVNNKIKFATESEYNINRFSKLLNNVEIIDYKIDMQGKSFVITFNKSDVENLVNINNDAIFIKEPEGNKEYIKALIRGIFLGSGSINNPKNTYHLEIGLSQRKNAEFIAKTLENMNVKVKNFETKNSWFLYIKDGEEMSKFLALIGANNSVLKFEGIRVERDINNKVNRLVNCETANLNKTINAAVEQIEAIKHLQKVNAFDKLNDNLKEIAIVRLEHPDSALSELGSYLKEPIGKSGVNYRLKKIIEIAKEN